MANNIPGQKTAPSAAVSERRVKDSELDKKMRNTVSADAPSKNISRDKISAAASSVIGKNDIEGTTRAPISKKSDTSSEGFSKAEIAAGEARRKRNAALVKAKPEDYAPATKKMAKPVVKSSPISSSYGSDEDVSRQNAIDENADFFSKRGVKPLSDSKPFKSGGMVKSSASSRGDGCAQRGKTKGRMI